MTLNILSAISFVQNYFRSSIVLRLNLGVDFYGQSFYPSTGDKNETLRFGDNYNKVQFVHTFESVIVRKK